MPTKPTMTTADPYNELKDALNDANAQISPSELHGILTGLVITKQGEAADEPEELIRLCGLPQTTSPAFLKVISEWMSNMLTSFEDVSRFDLELLLPGDDAPLAERTEALGDWVKGLQLGVTTGGLTDPSSQLSKDGAEIWDDLHEIGNIEPAREESEEAEEQWVNVLEYVKVGAYTLAQEFAEIQSDSDPDAIGGADSDYAEVYAEYIDRDDEL